MHHLIARILLLSVLFNLLTAVAAEAASGVVEPPAVTMSAEASGSGDEHEGSYHQGGFCDHSCHSSAHLLGIAVADIQTIVPAQARVLSALPHQSPPHQALDQQFRPPRLRLLA